MTIEEKTKSQSGPVPRPGLESLAPYVGGEGRVSGDILPVRLASNENPRGSSPRAREAYLSAADELHRYPDGAAETLRQAIAQHHGLPEDQIVCGAGSDELISLILRAYAGPGDEVIHSRHGFLMYAVGARAVGAVPVSVPEQKLKTDIDAVIAAVTPRTKAIFLANPNNPTGSLLPEADIARLVSAVPRHVVVVLDAAYAEYVEDENYAAGEIFVARHDNVVMLRTFSKIYGLAALRLGWAYAPGAMADILNRLRGPFNVSVPAQAAGIAALADEDFVHACRAENRAERGRLAEALAARGILPVPGHGNFLLARFGASAEVIRQALKEKGVFVRQMGAYGLPEHLRITVGTPDDNNRLLVALDAVLPELTTPP